LEAAVHLRDRIYQNETGNSLAGLFLGLVCVIGGMVLFLNGVAGSTSWSAKVLGFESQLSDAAPGSVLFVIGLFVIWITRYKVVTNFNEHGGIANQ
jgi:hypothetical protein